jgi:hypothetical protein
MEKQEGRHCCICGKYYLYDRGDGSDLRCCSEECEFVLLDEMYEEEEQRLMSEEMEIPY